MEQIIRERYYGSISSTLKYILTKDKLFNISLIIFELLKDILFKYIINKIIIIIIINCII